MDEMTFTVRDKTAIEAYHQAHMSQKEIKLTFDLPGMESFTKNCVCVSCWTESRLIEGTGRLEEVSAEITLVPLKSSGSTPPVSRMGGEVQN